MTERYFVETPIAGDCALLVGPEAHHLTHVMRAGPGAEVVLFDGSGAEFPARVERIGRAEVELAVLSREPVDRELPLELTVGVALPKGDRQRWLVEKATELGVTRLVPLLTAQSVARPEQKPLARLRRTVIEASKQCGRNRLMEIAQPRDWSDFVTDSVEAPHRLLAHPCSDAQDTLSLIGCHAHACVGMTRLFRRFRSCPHKRGHGTQLAVGPEGGFTDDEVSQAIDAGWQVIDLGPRTLRVETAAILLAGMVVRQVV